MTPNIKLDETKALSMPSKVQILYRHCVRQYNKHMADSRSFDQAIEGALKNNNQAKAKKLQKRSSSEIMIAQMYYSYILQYEATYVG